MALSLSTKKKPAPATDENGVPDWRQDPDVLRLIREVAELERRLPRLERDEREAGNDRQAATVHLQGQERRYLAGRASSADVAAAQGTVEKVRRAEAEAAIAGEEAREALSGARDQLAEATHQAKLKIVGDLRAAYRGAIVELDAALEAAKVANDRLIAIGVAAQRAFPLLSKEADRYGTAAGLPFGITWGELTSPSPVPSASRLGQWRRRVGRSGWLDTPEGKDLWRAAELERLDPR